MEAILIWELEAVSELKSDVTGFKFVDLERAGEYAACELWGTLGSADDDVRLIYNGKAYRADQDGFDLALAEERQ